jgi:SNF2 family DNA or RNA helicase
VTLTDAEMAVYENIRTKTMEGLEKGDINPIEALSALTKLRQAACHPRLVNPKLTLPSSKSAVFMALAEDLIENRHRVLVFSQFTSHLALIREELDAKKIPYLYLDGSHTAGQRKKLVEEFQGGDAPLFLISLKAGGLGLNLTGADYVIHLDPWWNPAVEDQASDRAYRIGQKRPVTIYKLIAANTIEEKIIDLHTTKKNLADALLEGSDVAKKLTREEILGLLQAANA